MPEPIAFHNGRFVPAADLHIAVHDAGFVLGVTVAEQLRTFNGKLFRLEEHLERFAQSLEIIGLMLPHTTAQLAAAAEEVAANNHALLESGDDLGLALFATPGPYPTMAPPSDQGPTVAMHTYPLPFRLFADKYETGQRLVASSVPQIPAASLPRELKCRSRVHYYLADREAARADPAARALMLDVDGTVLEATTANVLIYREREGLISPPRERILPGISVAATLELAEQLSIRHTHRNIAPGEAAAANEIMLTSTSMCIAPVVSLDGKPVGDGCPGPVFQQLLAGWGQLTGVDVATQAKRFARR